MGIKGLWDFIGTRCPGLHKGIPQESFRGLRIAIDVGGWMYKPRAKIRKAHIMRTDVVNGSIDEELIDRQWLASLLNQILSWLLLGITPILVFDGPSPPEKTSTKVSRTEKNDEVLAKIEELRKQIDQDRLDPVQNLLQGPLRLEAMQKLMSQLNYIPGSSIEMVRYFFEGIGMPVIVAKGEAERLAAALCREGIAAASFSPDGDSLTHLCPILIRDVGLDVYDAESKMAKPTFEVVYLSHILEGIDLTPAQFVDFCIMCGCDYNVNVRGVGPVGAYNLIRKHGSIDAIPNFNPDCLIHHRCRELFFPLPSSEQMPEGVKFEVAPSSEAAQEMFSSFSMDAQGTRFWRLLQVLPRPRDYVHLRQEYLPELGCLLESGDTLAGIYLLQITRAKFKIQAKKKALGGGRGQPVVASASRGRGRGRGRGAAASSS